MVDRYFLNIENHSLSDCDNKVVLLNRKQILKILKNTNIIETFCLTKAQEMLDSRV